MNKKSILFLSALDFKEKSIQVIRKTPEAYVEAGWDVTYIVCRDNSKNGNYFYEKEINPKGVNIIRFYMPFSTVKDKISNHTLKTIFSKVVGLLVVIMLSYHAVKFLRRSNIKILYGYEIHGILASKIVSLLLFLRKYKTINRFQGTWFMQYFNQKNYIKLLLNFDGLIAMKSRSDLCIMTDDGTQGDKALKIIKSRSLGNFKFWINGVDSQKLSSIEIEKARTELCLDKNDVVFLCLSRLESWKRVDRAIEVISRLDNSNVKFYIIGEGNQKDCLLRLAKEREVEDKVIFIGGVENSEVKKYLNVSNYFLSMYELSNVGNPLLEAIRANKIIFTLNNGDTSKWIKHKENGFIYDINSSLYENVAKDIIEIINDKHLSNKILENIKITEKDKLWTWKERMNAEIKEVELLIEN